MVILFTPHRGLDYLREMIVVCPLLTEMEKINPYRRAFTGRCFNLPRFLICILFL